MPPHPWFNTRSKNRYIAGQERKSYSRKYFFYSKVVGFRPGIWSFSNVTFNRTRFPVKFESG